MPFWAPSRTPFTRTSYRRAYCGSTSSADWSQKSQVSQPKSDAWRFPGAVGPCVSVLAGVVAVTVALGAEALCDGSTATTENECAVEAASRSTVTDRAPVQCRLSGDAGVPSTATRYVQQVLSSSATAGHDSPTVDEVVPVTETTGAAGGVVSTGSVTVTVL